MSNARAKKSTFNASLKPRKYRPTKAQQGFYTVRLIELTPELNLKAQQPEQLIELDQALSESGTSPC